MKASRLSLVLGAVGSACSITGLSVLWIARSLVASPENLERLLFGGIIFMMLVVAVVLAVWLRLTRAVRSLEGRVVRHDQRSEVSQAFAVKSVHTLRIFSGDLSWLVEDIAAYRTLRGRGVVVRVLTEITSGQAVDMGKVLGIEFRSRPQASKVPIRASLSDGEKGGVGRALVVKHETRRGTAKADGYSYWVREYTGDGDEPVINALTALFEEQWQSGTPL